MTHVYYTHDGLIQQTELYYKIQNNRRCETDMDHVFDRRVKLHLPLFLTVPLWKRHGYTVPDILNTLGYFSAIHLWQCALLFGISTSSSAVKIAFSTPESMVYGSKAIVIRKIKRAIQQNFDFPPRGSVLDSVRDDHIPPLPIHSIDKDMYDAMAVAMPKTVSHMLGAIGVGVLFDWMDILVAPLWIEKGALYCVRVVEKAVFLESNRNRHDRLSNRPVHIVVDGREYAGLEEAMFFTAGPAARV